MTCLILRAYLKTTYRGVIEYLDTSDKLQKCLSIDPSARVRPPALAGREKHIFVFNKAKLFLGSLWHDKENRVPDLVSHGFAAN